MRVGVLATLSILALIALPLTAAAGPAQDTDGDGTFDALDNCVLVANAAPGDCDTDTDGYGNACDGDFGSLFVPDFLASADSGIGSDMDCSGVVNSVDFGTYFVPNFLTGVPGPSGLSCAGTSPCP